jgi:hypothetical protein
MLEVRLDPQGDGGTALTGRILYLQVSLGRSRDEEIARLLRALNSVLDTTMACP